MSRIPPPRFTLIRTTEYLKQIDDMRKTGEYPMLDAAIKGAEHSIELNAGSYAPFFPNDPIRRVLLMGRGVQLSFRVWFELVGTTATLVGITHFDIPATGLWDSD